MKPTIRQYRGTISVRELRELLVKAAILGAVLLPSVSIARLQFRVCATTTWAAYTTASKCTRAIRCMWLSASNLMFAAGLYKEKPIIRPPSVFLERVCQL